MKRKHNSEISHTGINRRDHLQRLRGMFFMPVQKGRKKWNTNEKNTESGGWDDDLVLSREQGSYLGG
ncbi:MAG TPA: hypothetical protein PKG48_13560 [Bacteroidales bacterium]|nr:hypothetical protein [Bacteroidales bacterium]